jgi:hypothetical protein
MEKPLSTPPRTLTTLKLFGIALILVQLLDIIIHAATNQLEPLRVSSNIIIVVWLLVVAMRNVKLNTLQVAAFAIGAYLVLNVVFLALEGITNEAQGGSLRVALFILVSVTLLLSSAFTYLQKKPAD